MSKKVLITGVLGSGGSYLAEHLLSLGSKYELFGWYRTEHPEIKDLIADRMHLQQVDLLDYELVLSTLQKDQYDYIFHIASDANVRKSFDFPRETLVNNIFGTVNLLEGLRVHNLKPRFLMCSTSEVYGQVLPHEVPIKEENLIRPASPYSVSKITQDLLSGVYFQAYKIPVIRTRMFTYINPRRADLFATSFALQIARIESGKQSILKHGNLKSVRTFLDIRDAMNAYVCAMESGLDGETYNIGGTETHTVGDFLEILKSMAKVPIKSELDPQLLRPVDVTLQIPDCTLFKKRTNWKPQHSLKSSIEFLLTECRKRVARES